MDLAAEIDTIRKKAGSELAILAHHYQQATVVRHADDTGDSLELARKAASCPEAKRIVFCGVRFMAETADILTSTDQAVFMPDTGADCPMAQMANAAAMERAWADLGGAEAGWLPVVYVNSTAEIKARCGRWGGSACTSSNAERVFRWVFDQDRRVCFLPDEHLGVNTAHDLGIGEEDIAVYDPIQENGGLTPSRVASARVVVWKGYCHVHTAFTTAHVLDARRTWPNAHVIVHPEAPHAVVSMADAHGSTSQIIRFVDNAPDGDTIVVGTELNLVQRLAERARGRVTVVPLAPSTCGDMAQTTETNLLELLQNWPAERRIRVPTTVASEARNALQRMLTL